MYEQDEQEKESEITLGQFRKEEEKNIQLLRIIVHKSGLSLYNNIIYLIDKCKDLNQKKGCLLIMYNLKLKFQKCQNGKKTEKIRNKLRHFRVEIAQNIVHTPGVSDVFIAYK